MEIFGQTITLSNRFKIISHSKKIKAIIALGPFSSLSRNEFTEPSEPGDEGGGEGCRMTIVPTDFGRNSIKNFSLKRGFGFLSTCPPDFHIFLRPWCVPWCSGGANYNFWDRALSNCPRVRWLWHFFILLLRSPWEKFLPKYLQN